MNVHIGMRLSVAVALAAAAVLAIGLVALGVRSVVAGPDADPGGPVPNPGHAWAELQDHGVSGSDYWLGTTDNGALDLRVNGARALRLEPGATSPNVIGGFGENSATAGVVGVTIGGGGWAGSYANRVTDDYSTVSGGQANQAGDDAGTTTDARFATVGGGYKNTASNDYDTVGGGDTNSASGGDATVGGGWGNTASGQGATIGGGVLHTASGNDATVGGGNTNTANNQSTTVGGGANNTASGDQSTVGGGGGNAASGVSSTVGGGDANTAGGGTNATVGGGHGNTASGNDATVGGGNSNVASGFASTVPGGNMSTAAGDYSFAAGRRAKANHQGSFVWADSTDADFASTTADQFLVRASGGVSLNVTGGGLRLEPNADSPNVIGGYSGNSVTSGAAGAFIGGGGDKYWTNRVTDGFGTVGGGANNIAGDDAGTPDDTWYATVGGGANNTASGDHSTVGGGWDNSASEQRSTVGGGNEHHASGGGATISGGSRNTAGYEATVGGGHENDASADYATVGGGVYNIASGAWATVGGGADNAASAWNATVGGGGLNTASGGNATVGGGFENTASNGNATVGGGGLNTASGFAATVPGGALNTAAGDDSFAAGYRAKANDQGAFVWADSNDLDFASTAANEFSARTTGGARFVSAIDGSGNPTAGVQLAAGGGSWTSISDRNLKDNFTPVDGQAVLASLAEIPITTWNYKAQDAAIRHMGPVAQDFYAAFGLGESETGISTVDADGVALAAIQGLYQLAQEQAARIQTLEDENASLQQRLGDLEGRVAALEGGVSTSGAAGNPLSGLSAGWLVVGGLVVMGLALVQRRRAGGRP